MSPLELELKPFPFTAAVVFTEEQNDELCDLKGFKDRSWVSEGNHAEVQRYGSLAVVRISEMSEVEPHLRVGIYAHEATHVFQAMCEFVSETEPSDEFEAYFIQAVTQWLFKETECYLLSTSDSSLQLPLPLSSEEESGTSVPSEEILQNPELE